MSGVHASGTLTAAPAVHAQLLLKSITQNRTRKQRGLTTGDDRPPCSVTGTRRTNAARLWGGRRCFPKAALKPVALGLALILECFPPGEGRSARGREEGKGALAHVAIPELHAPHPVSTPCSTAPVPGLPGRGLPPWRAGPAQQEMACASVSVLPSPGSGASVVLTWALPLILCACWVGVRAGCSRSAGETEGWRPDPRAVKIRGSLFQHLKHPPWVGGQDNSNILLFASLWSTSVFPRAFLFISDWSLMSASQGGHGRCCPLSYR